MQSLFIKKDPEYASYPPDDADGLVRRSARRETSRESMRS
jgi:hypothetical protein